MIDEIKEKPLKEVLYALDYIGNKLKNDDGAFDSATLELNVNNCKILIDYITNLQEEVNQYKNPDDMTLFYMWLDEKAKDKIKHLQEENNYLKMNNPEQNLEHFRILKENKRKIDNLREENKRLKNELEIMTFTAKIKQDAVDALISRIDKANEYIKEHTDKLKTIRVPKIDFNYDILLEKLELKGDK